MFFLLKIFQLVGLMVESICQWFD